MAIKILSDKIQIGNYSLYENPYGVIFDGIIQSEEYEEKVDSRFGDNILVIKTDGLSNSNSQIFKDESGNQIEVVRGNNATSGSFSPFSNNYSVYFDGSGDYLTVSSNVAFQFSSNDSFLIECWVNFVDGNTNSLRMIWTNYNAWGTNAMFFGKHTNQSGRVALWIYNYSTGGPLLQDPTLPPTGRWVHYAVQRTVNNVGGGVNWYLFRDGVQVSSATWTGDPTGTNGACQIGGNSEASGAYCLHGWISNMRIMKGSVPYSLVGNSSFIPFRTQMTQGSNANVSGIFCSSNRFLDRSSNNRTVSIGAGTPFISPYSPLQRQYEYTPANNAGSVYLDGSGDFLYFPANDLLKPGTGDFTISLWWYPTASGSNQRVVSHNWNSNPAGGYSNYMIYYNGSALFYYSSTNGGSWNNINALAMGTPQLNVWNYLAVSRVNGVLRTFLNGSVVSTTADAGDLNNLGNVYIGTYGNGEYAKGYFAGFKFERGNGYGSMPIPTAPPTPGSNTSVLLNFRNTGIYDATECNNIETVDQIDTNTFVTIYGSGTKRQGSIYFDGTNDYLKIPFNTTFHLANSDFTIEGWVISQSNSITLAPIVSFGWVYGAYAPIVIFNNNGTLTAYASSSGSSWNVINATTFGTLTLGTWHHIAISRFGTTIRLYHDGVAKANITSVTATLVSPAVTSNITFGADSSGTASYFFNGYMQDFKITKGIARYTTATFTPPVFENPVR